MMNVICMNTYNLFFTHYQTTHTKSRATPDTKLIKNEPNLKKIQNSTRIKTTLKKRKKTKAKLRVSGVRWRS